MSDDKVEEMKKDGKQPVTAQTVSDKIRGEEKKVKEQELEKATREMLKAKEAFLGSVEKVHDLEQEVASYNKKPKIDLTSLLNMLR